MNASHQSPDDRVTKKSLTFSDVLATMREWWRPIMAAFILCGLVITIGPSDSTDRRMSDRLLVTQAHSPAKDFVLIEVDAGDLRKYGRPILTRENLAALVNVVADAKPKRFMIDLYLGDGVDPMADADLERALSRYTPKSLGLVTSPGPDDLPFERFAKHGAILDARLTADVDGWHRGLGSDDPASGYNPAFWLATGETRRGAVDFDLRISHWDYPRYSVDDVFEGMVDLKGKIVILSASPDVAPTRAYLPLVQAASRTAVLAVAAQSVTNDYVTVEENGHNANLALQLLAILLGFLVALKAETGKKLILWAVVLGVCLIVANLSIATKMGSQVYPTKTLACFLVMVNVTVVQRLKIVPMMSSFIKGDVSPEEAWAWRSSENSQHPALLFGANGKIKRSNAAAKGLVEQYGEDLPRLCLPSLGQRTEALSFDDEGATSFEIDWPYGSVPIAIFRDNSESELLNRNLREQLYTDELTGCTNRRGFDMEMSKASRSGQKFVLFFIDMNGFKQVNDTYGHDAGDELLVVSSQRMQDMIRGTDVLARLGGDEFAVIMFGTDNENFAIRQQDQLVSALSQPVELSSTDGSVKVGAAVGYAMLEDADEDIGDVLRRADQAMYRNKAEMKLLQKAA